MFLFSIGFTTSYLTIDAKFILCFIAQKQHSTKAKNIHDKNDNKW